MSKESPKKYISYSAVVGRFFKVSLWCSYPCVIPSHCAWVVSDFWATKYKSVEGMYGITCTVHDHVITLHSTVVSVFLKYSPFWLWKSKWPRGQPPCGKKLQAVSGYWDCLQGTSVFSPNTRNKVLSTIICIWR